MFSDDEQRAEVNLPHSDEDVIEKTENVTENKEKAIQNVVQNVKNIVDDEKKEEEKKNKEKAEKEKEREEKEREEKERKKKGKEREEKERDEKEREEKEKEEEEKEKEEEKKKEEKEERGKEREEKEREEKEKEEEKEEKGKEMEEKEVNEKREGKVEEKKKEETMNRYEEEEKQVKIKENRKYKEEMEKWRKKLANVSEDEVYDDEDERAINIALTLCQESCSPVRGFCRPDGSEFKCESRELSSETNSGNEQARELLDDAEEDGQLVEDPDEVSKEFDMAAESRDHTAPHVRCQKACRTGVCRLRLNGEYACKPRLTASESSAAQEAANGDDEPEAGRDHNPAHTRCQRICQLRGTACVAANGRYRCAATPRLVSHEDESRHHNTAHTACESRCPAEVGRCILKRGHYTCYPRPRGRGSSSRSEE
jgi:hypothetical protein